MNKGPIRRYRNQIWAQKPTDQALLGNQTFKQGVIPLSAIDRDMIPWKTTFHLTLVMTLAQVVKTSVTVADNSPFEE